MRKMNFVNKTFDDIWLNCNVRAVQKCPQLVEIEKACNISIYLRDLLRYDRERALQSIRHLNSNGHVIKITHNYYNSLFKAQTDALW